MRLRWLSILILVAVSIVSTITFGGSQVPQITGLSWQQNLEVVQVTFDQFPDELWNEQWEMYIDNNKMPVVAPQGSPNVRPNAELKNNPTGVFIGDLPWLSSLSKTNFPGCGAIKFCIPRKGYHPSVSCTNEFQFNLAGEGCKTASSKYCESGKKSSPSSPPIDSSGVVWDIRLEDNTDRPGMDIFHDARYGLTLEQCALGCAILNSCKAFTYVKEGFGGPNSAASCHLKSSAPDPFPKEGCVSGVKYY